MIKLVIPSLPPSSNNAYVNIRGGHGRTLSSEGRQYKTDTLTYLAKTYRLELQYFKPNVPYQLLFRFFFEDIENKGWGNPKTQTRYKRFDGGNRTKLLEDVLKDAGGIDDSQTMTTIWQKKRGKEATHIWAWNLELEHDPFDLDYVLEHL